MAMNLKGILDQVGTIGAGVIGLDLLLGFFGVTFLADITPLLTTGMAAPIVGYAMYRFLGKKYNLPVPL